jgi:hypothetical protein
MLLLTAYRSQFLPRWKPLVVTSASASELMLLVPLVCAKLFLCIFDFEMMLKVGIIEAFELIVA